jgi:thymidylate synthase (FAD)
MKTQDFNDLVEEQFCICKTIQMMVFCARITQRGHKIKNMNDLDTLLNKEYSYATVKNMCSLPHPTIQKFGAIHIAVVGASRRFLAQITRHTDRYFNQ